MGQSGLTRRFADNSWSTVSGAWTQTNELKGVAYGNGTFVAVGNAGTILTSSNDGTTWTKRSSGSTTGLNAVSYGTPGGNGLFVAVGSQGAMVKSNDGTNWASVNTGTANTLHGVTYGNGLFVAVGDNATIITSPNGTNWTLRDTGGIFSPFYGVAYGNGVYVAVGGGWVETGKIFTSEDGIIWTSRTSGVTNYLTAVAYGNNRFVAVGGTYEGTAIILLSTNNGVDWSRSPSGTTEWFYGVTYGNNLFAAVGSNYLVKTSADGSSWSGGLGANVVYRAVSYGNGAFAVVGDTGTLRTSSNGSSWTTKTSGTSNSLYGVTFGNNTFLAVGNNGTILQSGTIVAPQISVDPAAVAIGNVGVGSASSTQITISNSADPGSLDLSVGSISISGDDAAMFSVSEGGANACASLTPTIAADGNCTLLITFTPASSGAKSAVLNITSNATDSPTTVNLSGTGKSTLSVTKTGSGTITSVPAAIDCGVTCSAQFNPDQNITLSTSASAGYYFSSWGGACAGAGGCAFNMNTDRTVSATFSQCTYSLESASTSIASAGGDGNISLTTSCAWTAAKDAEWITITSDGSGSGNGTVGYTVAANNGPARTGTINVSGQVFTINQASGCAYVIDPSSSSYSSAVGSGNLSVTASNSNCAWTASSNNSWITVTSGGSASGSAQIGYSISVQYRFNR